MATDLKDPFVDEPRKPAARPAADSEPSPSLTKGKARRNLHIVGLIVLAAGVVTWMFWPESSKGVSPPAPVTASDLPSSETAGKRLLRDLQEDAAASAPVADPRPVSATMPTPMGNGSAASRALAGPDPVPGASGPSREEEIWGAPIATSGGVTLKKVGTETPAVDPLTRAAAGGAAAASGADSLPERQLALLSQLGQPQPAAGGRSADNAFLKQAASDTPNLTNRQQPGYGQAAVYQGAVIRSVLVTGLNSDMPGTVIASVTSTVYDSVTQRIPLIPAGSKLVGVYRNEVQVGQTRILVAMQRLILPNGTWIPLSGASATDTQGMAGMDADVNNHFVKIFGSSLVIGAASLLASRSSQNVTVNVGAGGTQLGGSVFAQTLSETVRTMLQRNLNIQPTLTVDAGSEFLFVVSRDTLLSPWSGT
ncbi:TrbI/VirB10 family protein (plasmid) [Cupriavidus basilensis]